MNDINNLSIYFIVKQILYTHTHTHTYDVCMYVCMYLH